MGYESYYETMNEEGMPGGKPKRRGMRIFLIIVGVAGVFFISGLLIMGVIQSTDMQGMYGIFPTPGFIRPPETQQTEKQPKPTPWPEQRPMIELDGVAPIISAADGNPIPDIVEAVSPSVVGVVNYVSLGGDDPALVEQGMGSGFFISSQGYVLTNAHVVQGADALSVTLLSGTELDAELIAKDDLGDVAVLRVKGADVKPLKLGDSSAIRVGEYVMTIGNPLGRNYEGTVTMGIVSARTRAVTIEGQTNMYIQTDAAINVGNSGGPLLNMQGEVIGINTAKTINAGHDEFGMSIGAEGMGFALPITRVCNVVEQLVTKGFVEHAALGVYVQQLNRQDMLALGLEHGVLVAEIVRDGPAEKAGLLAKDVILFYDGYKAENQNNIINYVRDLPIGTSLSLTIWRNGEELEIGVVLESMEDLDYNDTVDED